MIAETVPRPDSDPPQSVMTLAELPLSSAEAQPAFDASTTAANPLLPLFLIVLAFFIVLVSLSQPQAERSAAVLKSVSETFQARAPDGEDPNAPAAAAGQVLGAAALSDRLRRVFASALPLVEWTVNDGGRQLAVSVPVNAIFRDGSTELTRRARLLFDDIVIAIGERPSGLRVFVLVTTTRGGSVDVAGAATLGDALASRGVAVETLTVGVAERASDDVDFTFRIEATVAGPGLGEPLL